MAGFTKRLGKNPIAYSLLMIVAGIILLLWPGVTLEVTVRVIGISLLAAGCFSILNWYRHREVSYSTLAAGIIFALIGLIILVSPRRVISIFPTAMGLFVLVNGVFNLALALDQKQMSYEKWNISLVMAVVTIILGILILANPFSTMSLLIMVVGGILIYNGVTSLWIGTRKKR